MASRRSSLHLPSSLKHSASEEAAVATALLRHEAAIARLLLHSPEALAELRLVAHEIRTRTMRARDALRDGGEREGPPRGGLEVAAELRKIVDSAAVMDEPSSRALLEEDLVEMRLHRRVLDRVTDAVPRRHPIAPLLRRSRALADDCKARLVTANLHVAVAVARHYRRAAIESADLVQEGTIGLLRACDKYDPKRGHRFGAYAGFWVRQQIARGLVEQEGTIRIPLEVAAARHRVSRTQKKFSAAHGRSASNDELVEATGLTRKVMETLRHLPLDPLRLHGTLADGEGDLMSRVADETIAPVDASLEVERSNARVHRLLRRLPRIDAAVLTLRFGLDGEEEMTRRSVGERLQLTRERVGRVEERALARLVALFREDGLTADAAA